MVHTFGHSDNTYYSMSTLLRSTFSRLATMLSVTTRCFKKT